MTFRAHFFKVQIDVLFATIIATGAFPLSEAATHEMASIRQDILKLQKLGAVNQELAIGQMESLLAATTATVSEPEQRDLIINLLFLETHDGKSDKAKQLIDELESLGQRSHDLIATAMALNYRARLLQDEGKFLESLEIIEQAYDAASRCGNKLTENQVELTATELYALIGNFNVALVHEQKAIDAINAIPNPAWEVQYFKAKTFNIAGFLYLSIKDQHSALEYLAKAMDIAETLNAPIMLADIHNNRGYAYADLKQWNLATKDYKEAAKLGRDGNSPLTQSTSYINLADASFNQGNYKACTDYAQEAMQIAKLSHKDDGAAIAMGNLGICDIYLGAIAKGEDEVQKSIAFARQSNALPTIDSTLGDLSAAYAKVGRYKEAWNTLQDKEDIAQKLIKAERDHATIELTYQFNQSQRLREQESEQAKNAQRSLKADNATLKEWNYLFLLLLILCATGNIIWLVRVRRERQERQNIEQRRRALVMQRDPLTGLLQRSAFQIIIDQMNEAQSEGDHVDVLVLIRIDQFEQVSDKYGAAEIDDCLVQLSQRIDEVLREKDVMMRWGGGEFLVFLHGVTTQRAKNIVLRMLHGSANFPEESVPVSASIGYVLHPLPGAAQLNWETALNYVAAALQVATERGEKQACGIIAVNTNAGDMPTPTSLEEQATLVHFGLSE